MGMAMAYTIIATGIMLLLTLSSSPNKDVGRLKLTRRLGNALKLEHAPFDPLVAQWERNEEEGGFPEEMFDWNTPPSWDAYIASDPLEDPHEYFSQDGEVNVTGRLQILFPLIDRSSKDDVISLAELEAWNVWQAHEQMKYKAWKEIEEYDKNGDYAVSFAEYLPHITNQNIDWWKQKFLIVDADGNGRLTFTELIDFLHPGDSNNEELQLWLQKDEMRKLDHDMDGKINFVEFRGEAYDLYKFYFEFEHIGKEAPNAEKVFAGLDHNEDRLLSEEEVRPLIRQFNSGEIAYAKYYAQYLIHQADDNEDGKLTLQEMLNHAEIFYSAVLKESDFDDKDDSHSDL